MKKIGMLVLGLGAFSLAAAWAGRGLTDKELEARFYYDLGPEEIDVSGYPELHRQRYEWFRQTCSQCHTAARPINSPITEKKDWKRYVTRMHLKDKARGGLGFFKEEAQQIVEFLVYDSQERKVKNKDKFAAKTLELKTLYDEVRKERARMKKAEDKAKTETREQAPYRGVK